RHIAVNARDRSLTVDIAFCEAVDHCLLEAVLVIENVVRNTNSFRNSARIVNILARATGTLTMDRGAVIVELQGDADDIVTLCLEQGGGHRRVDAPRHGDDDARILRSAVEIEAIEHSLSYYRW